MRIYTEMECDCGCEDGKFCIYFNKDTKSCDFHKMRNVKIVKNKDKQQKSLSLDCEVKINGQKKN